MKNIKISEILDDLTRGLARSPKHGGYKPEVGSIQEKYNLTTKELNYLFKHEKLKNTRAGLPVGITIEDDTVETVVSEEVPNTSGLSSEHFDNPTTDAPWNEEINRAREQSRSAVEILTESK